MITAAIRALAAALAVLALLCAPAAAQFMGPPEPPAAEGPAPDPFGRETPRGAVDGLLAAFASGEPDAATPYLDLSDIPEGQQRLRARRLASQLERALDSRGTLLPGFRIAAQPEGVIGDGLSAELDRFAILDTPQGPADLLLRRGEAEAGAMVWRVAPEALQLAAQVAPTGPAFVERHLPSVLTRTEFWGASAAAWLSVLAVGAAALVLGALAVLTLLFAVRRIVPPLRSKEARRLVRPMRLPAALILSALMFQAGIRLAGIPVVVRAATAPVVETAAWIALAWLVLRAIHAGFDEALRRMTLRERLGAVSVISMVRRIVKVVILIAAAMLIASSLGLDLTGWIAAFGLGGLAFALGAQKTIEHMVGGMSLIADQPLRVGDFCAVDGLMGTVEDIGLRSTRLRTLDRTLVTIPNGDLSGARIENYANRDRFKWQVVLGLRYETSPEQMRMVLARLDALLSADARIAEGHRARFKTFGASSLDIEIFAYVLAKDYATSLIVIEELNLAVMEIVDECGTGFAFPSTTVYLARDDKPAPARLAAA